MRTINQRRRRGQVSAMVLTALVAGVVVGGLVVIRRPDAVRSASSPVQGPAYARPVTTKPPGLATWGFGMWS